MRSREAILCVIIFGLIGTVWAGQATLPRPVWNWDKLQTHYFAYDPTRTTVYNRTQRVPVLPSLGLTHLVTTGRTFRVAQSTSNQTSSEEQAPSVPTTITVTGGARTVSTRLPAGQSTFSLNVPLRPNTENTLTVEAVDENGRRAVVSDLKVTQISLSDILVAEVTAQRLTVEEVKQLVADGTVDLTDPENFNVSVFDIVLNINGNNVPVRMPVVRPKEDPQPATSPPIKLVCGRPGQALTFTEQTIAIPCAGGGGGPDLQIQVVDIPLPPEVTPPEQPSIPGVIIIEGRIKTLKEFFNVKLLLMNVSTLFTLEDPTATIEVPEGALTPIVPASGPIMLNDLPPQAEDTGEFIVRGDRIGIHTVTVHFGGFLTGFGIPDRIAVSGQASTQLEVKGPPPMDVEVSHPDFVEEGEPYTLTVTITNTSPDVPALFTSLELDVGGDAHLLDPETGEERIGPQIESIGDLLPGKSVTRKFQVLPLKTGPITSCTGGVSQNLTLSVLFTGGRNIPCAVGTFPADRVDPEGKPTVQVVPPHNTVDVSPDTLITAFFSAEMIPETITTGFPEATFLVQEPDGTIVQGTLEFGSVFSGTTATFRPAAPLKFDTTYTISISPNIFDQDGNGLASGLAAHFTTQPAPRPVDDIPPTVPLIVEPPVNPGAIPRGLVVPLLAEATDNTEVERVELLLDGAMVDLKRPQSPVRFTFDTTPFEAGSMHTFQARAFDLAGNVGLSAPVIVTMVGDASSPEVNIQTAETVDQGRQLNVTIEATDDGKVEQVDLFLDEDELVFSGKLAPFVAMLATATLDPGEHSLRAVATDAAGNSAETTKTFTVIGDTTPPTVVISSPADGSQFLEGILVPVLVTATDNIGVASVEIFLDDEPTPRATDTSGFQLSTAELELGVHTIRAVAQDLSGNETTTQASFTIFAQPTDTTPPPPPDGSLIQADAAENGITTVTGQPGSVEAGARIEILNLDTQAGAQAIAGADGSF
ncbi:MAG: hypothetical protein D6736_09585, partial [Nitrospinota bacterium]